MTDKPVTVTPELLPCPFCGSPSLLKCIPLDERFGYAARYEARCTNCLAQISATDKQNPKGGYALSTGAAEAITAWNTRTAHAPSQPTAGDDGPAETIGGFETGATVTPNTPDTVRRDAVIEECAKVAECLNGWGAKPCPELADRIAAAIRALATKDAK